MSALCDELFNSILMARQRVYAVAGATPLEEVAADLPFRLFVKREDLGPIKAYKWRGAYNRMAKLSPEERSRGIVAASAGNHAQGVALAAKLLGIRGRRRNRAFRRCLRRCEPRRARNRRAGTPHVRASLRRYRHDGRAGHARRRMRDVRQGSVRCRVSPNRRRRNGGGVRVLVASAISRNQNLRRRRHESGKHESGVRRGNAREHRKGGYFLRRNRRAPSGQTHVPAVSRAFGRHRHRNE